MKFPVILLFIFWTLEETSAQFVSPININGDSEFVYKPFPVDIDGDGDLDFLTTNSLGQTVEWYENLDGLGNFGPVRLISDEFLPPRNLLAVDFDSDNDMDVVIEANSDNKIVWFENLDGLGNFESQQTVVNTTSIVQTIKFADLDNDDDLDLIIGDINGKISWFENLNGLGNFGGEQIISMISSYVRMVYISDIDGDSDIDVISISNDRKIAWYENVDGQGNFGSQNIIFVLDFPNLPTSVISADFDGDGDIDIAYTSLHIENPSFGWLENTNSLGDFKHAQFIDETLRRMEDSVAFDVENDGDIDIVTAGLDIFASEWKVAWYPNDGTGFFEPRIDITLTTDQVRWIAAGNFNGDDFIDFAICTGYDLDWYKNTGDITLAIENKINNTLNLYPNPTNGIVKFNYKKSIKSITIFNSLGYQLTKFLNQSEIDISGFPSGLYFLKIEDENGEILNEKIIKR